MKTNDVNMMINDLFSRKGVQREFHRIAPFSKLADQIILLRKKRDITQTELADKANTTQAVISRIENASVHCSLETVIKLAEALDAYVEVKLIEIEEPENQTNDVRPDNCFEVFENLINDIYETQAAKESKALYSRGHRMSWDSPSFCYSFGSSTSGSWSHKSEKAKSPEFA